MLSNEISSFTLPLVVVLLLGGIGAVIMLAAGFNYIGLTIARSLQRAKEVGIRKTVGAHRRQVILQFLAESVLMALAALVLAYVLLAWLLPGFNNLTVIQRFDIRLETESIYNPQVAGAFLAFSLMVGLLAGLYPAFYLSRFDPVLVLKGAGLGQGHTRLRLRKVLVTAQLVFSLVFLISGLLIYRQLDYIINFDYGFRTAMIRTHPDKTEQVMAHLEAVWKSIDPVHPIVYTFYDTQLRYDDDGAQGFWDLVKVVGMAAFIALAIGTQTIRAALANPVDSLRYE